MQQKQKPRPKLALRVLTAAAAALIALPLAILTTSLTSALAATNQPNAGSVAGRAKPPTPTTTQTTCTSAAASGPQRCIRVQRQRLSLSTLSAAQRSYRDAMFSKQIAKDKASRTNAATASSSVSLTPPADCLMAPGNEAASYVPNPDRFTSCSDVMITVTSYPVVDGVPDYENPNGGFQYEDAQWNSYSATSQSWAHGLIVVGYPAPVYAWGTLVTGVSAQMYSGCFLATGICTAISLGNPDPQSVTVLPSSTQEFGWTEYDDGPSATTANSSNWMDSYLGVSYDLDIVPPAVINDLSELSGRCDTLANATDGCVDEYYYPTLTYNAMTNPLVEPVAEHILKAQSGLASGGLSIAWGVPSAYNSTGEALTRDTSSADQTANNKAACASVTVPTGYNCDEFPLATTHQGAAFQPIYSAIPVLASANSSQGGLTNAFYKSNRVINYDPFYVNVVLQSGAVSW